MATETADPLARIADLMQAGTPAPWTATHRDRDGQNTRRVDEPVTLSHEGDLVGHVAAADAANIVAMKALGGPLVALAMAVETDRKVRWNFAVCAETVDNNKAQEILNESMKTVDAALDAVLVAAAGVLTEGE